MAGRRRSKDRRSRWGIALIAAGLSVALGSAFGGVGTRTREAEGTGGAGLADVAWPKRVTAGESTSKIFGPGKVRGAELRGLAATRVEATKARFNGMVAGVRLVDPAAATALSRCSRDRLTFVGEAMLRANGSFVDVESSSLPSGAFEVEAPFGEACAGTVVTVSRQFQLLPYGGTVGVVRRIGTTTVPYATSRDRVRTGTVDGRDAVFIMPVTQEGFGDSAILVADGGSVTIIAADSVTFADLLRVAQGVI